MKLSLFLFLCENKGEVDLILGEYKLEHKEHLESELFFSTDFRELCKAMVTKTIKNMLNLF